MTSEKLPLLSAEGSLPPASKLSAFTFITPLFGVVASYLILHETLTPVFGAAALLVIAGLFLVNRPGSAAPVTTDPLLTTTET
jgi:drug/metabolite transporter (DMT)-like permease